MFTEVQILLTMSLFPLLHLPVDTGVMATFPLATEQMDYSISRFGWELPNVYGRQPFQAVLTTFFQEKLLLVAPSLRQGYPTFALLTLSYAVDCPYPPGLFTEPR